MLRSPGAAPILYSKCSEIREQFVPIWAATEFRSIAAPAFGSTLHVHRARAAADVCSDLVHEVTSNSGVVRTYMQHRGIHA